MVLGQQGGVEEQRAQNWSAEGRGVDPATPRALWEYSVFEVSQMNQAGLGSLFKSQKRSVPDAEVSSQLEYPHLEEVGMGGKETEAGGASRAPNDFEQPFLS